MEELLVCTTTKNPQATQKARENLRFWYLPKGFFFSNSEPIYKLSMKTKLIIKQILPALMKFYILNTRNQLQLLQKDTYYSAPPRSTT